jgi:hypothetical protein
MPLPPKPYVSEGLAKEAPDITNWLRRRRKEYEKTNMREKTDWGVLGISEHSLHGHR